MDDLLRVYQQKLNLYGSSFERIEHQDAMVAIVYKITCPSGEQLILKISTRSKDYFRERYFLEHFAKSFLPVPRKKGLVSPKADICGAILMECVPGALLDAAKLSREMAYDIGGLLARIHSNRVEGYGDLARPESLTMDARFHFSQKFEEAIDECTGNLSDLLIDKCRHYVDRHIDLLLLADGPCIVHRDFRPGNLLVLEGKLQAIIDWASSAGSFAQEDPCSIEHNWAMTPENKRAFLAGYAAVRSVPDFQNLIPLLRLQKAIATIGFTVKRGTWKNTKAFLYQKNLQFLKNFF